MSDLSRLVPLGLLSSLLAVPLPVSAESERAAGAEEVPTVEDVIVVTGSRVEERLREVPATITVLTGEELQNAPASGYADVLRSVPGLNVSQISARDVQINGRGASGALSGDQLVLLDSRSVYLDFFGLVMWDLLPVDLRELARIEVVRGPGSAVWGANAMGGVVNLITKSPWELEGGRFRIGGGELGTLYAGGSWARGGKSWGLKASASYTEQDPYDRPTGLVPGTDTPYPDFPNQGTQQPKVDLRLDKDLTEGDLFSFSAGWAETDGVVHSGIGPFDIDGGSSLGFLETSWTRGGFEARAYANLLDGSAANLLSVGVDGLPLTFGFETDSYHVEVRDRRPLGPVGLVVGASARRTDYDISIAPSGDQREELGVFAQADIELTSRLRWVVGARWDDIDPIGSVVSPRTGLALSPTPEHTFRFSFNRAFRAPAVVETNIDTTIVSTVDFSSFVGSPLFYSFPTASIGNSDLKEEKLTSYELSYLGTLHDGRLTIGLSVYRNELEGPIDFRGASFYSSSAPPPGWPLPLFVLDLPGVAGTLPSAFTYANIGEQVDRGMEFSFDYRPNATWRWSVGGSFQQEPEVEDIALEEINIPPTYRCHVAAGYQSTSWFGDAALHFVDGAYWSDVLDARFHGPTGSYSLLNGSIGHRWAGDRIEIALIGTNLLDEEIQQHVFGDILSRKVVAEIRFSF